ncbi:MAG TPA: DMT family transporter [Xanthomonadales bacterium]|nr:DMT family transporter [Xanthomonadales bacterium]
MKKLLAFGPVFIIIASLLWSFDALLRVSLYTLPPAVVVFYEHIFGLLVMLLLFPLWIRDLKKMTRKDWIVITLIGLFAGALGTIFYTAALGMVQYIPYSVVVLLQQLEPIFAISIAALLLKEKITKRFLLWAGLALVAAYLISFKDLQVNLQTGGGTALAALLAISAAAMWGAGTSLGRYVLKDISFLSAAALRFAIAPVFALIIIFGLGQQSAMVSLSQQQIITLVGITFSTGLIAMLIYYYGLKRTPARIATICELTWPASAIFIDYFMFGKTLSPTQILGVALLLLAIYQVTKPLAKNSKKFVE